MMKKNLVILAAFLLVYTGVSLLSLPLFGPDDRIQVYRAEVIGEDGAPQLVTEQVDLDAAANVLKDVKRLLLPRSVGPQTLRPGDVELGVLVGNESYHIYLSTADKHSNYCYRAGHLGHRIRTVEELYGRLTILLP